MAVCLGLLLAGAAGVQLLIAVLFRRRFVVTVHAKSSSEETQINEPLDRAAAILMSLRGNDPSLPESIAGALSQEYGGPYQVRVVVDHETDPAVVVLEDLKQNHPHGDRLSYCVMEAPSKTCSLKCHSLSQAVKRLPPEIEYVVLLDADVRPHPTWLAELIKPLSDEKIGDEKIGGVTGTQWFEPPAGAGTGAWLRSVWNGGAAMLSICFANPWAGSFAMRRSDLLTSGLVERWQQSMVDDGPIRAAMNSIDKQIHFVPSLVMVNRENCTLSYTLRWAARMLTWSRRNESTFWITIVHAVFSNFVMLANFAVLAAGLTGWLLPAVVWISLAALIFAGIACAAAFAVARSCVSESLRLRSQTLPPLVGRHWFWAFACAAPAHLMFSWGCVMALITKKITWRGINYRLGAKGEIERLNYLPFAEIKSKTDHSI